jgi:transposase
VHPADIQDRDGAVPLFRSIRTLYPWLRRIFADGAYAGDKLKDALSEFGTWTFEIIKRSDIAKGFEVLPRRSASRASRRKAMRARPLPLDEESMVSDPVRLVGPIAPATKRGRPSLSAPLDKFHYFGFVLPNPQL